MSVTNKNYAELLLLSAESLCHEGGVTGVVAWSRVDEFQTFMHIAPNEATITLFQFDRVKFLI